MSTNIKIFQIYFKPELLANCDPNFIPWDNTSNPRPDLREWYVWDQHLKQNPLSDDDLVGFVSHKFKEKTNLTGQQVLDWIEKNPGHDVYLLNPCIVNEAVFLNSWEQGDIWHPNISQIGKKFLKKVGYPDIEIKGLVLDRNRTVFANYIVGNKKFWDKFMTFSRRLFTEADTDLEFQQEVFGAGGSKYAFDASLPNFTFLIERLIPTFLDLEEFDSLGFYYDHPDLCNEKYRPYYEEITALSNLKMLINKHQSDELYDIWNFYRSKLLQQNSEILKLE